MREREVRRIFFFSSSSWFLLLLLLLSQGARPSSRPPTRASLGQLLSAVTTLAVPEDGAASEAAATAAGLAESLERGVAAVVVPATAVVAEQALSPQSSSPPLFPSLSLSLSFPPRLPSRTLFVTVAMAGRVSARTESGGRSGRRRSGRRRREEERGKTFPSLLLDAAAPPRGQGLGDEDEDEASTRASRAPADLVAARKKGKRGSRCEGGVSKRRTRRGERDGV